MKYIIEKIITLIVISYVISIMNRLVDILNTIALQITANTNTLNSIYELFKHSRLLR